MKLSPKLQKEIEEWFNLTANDPVLFKRIGWVIGYGWGSLDPNDIAECMIQDNENLLECPKNAPY